jgi:hypothetical protein
LESIWNLLEALRHCLEEEHVALRHKEAFELVLAIEVSSKGLAAEPENTELVDTGLKLGELEAGPDALAEFVVVEWEQGQFVAYISHLGLHVSQVW